MDANVRELTEKPFEPAFYSRSFAAKILAKARGAAGEATPRYKSRE